MKRLSNSIKYFILFFLSIIILSCADSSGLGESVDTTPPLLTITELTCPGLDSPLTSFSGGVYCKKEVTISGTASDDKKVSKVYVQSKWAGESDYTYLKEASLSGNNWTASFTFENEGVLFLRFIAEDPAKNYSNKSSKVIALFIDETAPTASAWYIDRQINGIQYNLKELDTLKALDLNASENKDAAQNVSCTLRANFTDTMGIKADSVSVQLRDEEGNKICDISNSGTSEYAPAFVISQELLTHSKESLASGLHYIQVVYSAEDVVTLPESNSACDIEIDGGWLIWWAESDQPKIRQNDMESDSEGNESINLYVDDVISLSVFDDDELKNAFCALLSESEYEAFTINWSEIENDPQIIINAVAEEDRTKRTASYTASSGEREASLILHAASTPQTMHLLAIAWDNTEANKVTKKDIAVRVIDATSPILLITSPANNSIPAVTMSSDNSKAEVTVQGQTLDSIGCTYLEFVWVPDSVAESGKTDKAKEWLEEIDSDQEHESIKSAGSVSKDGMKLWTLSLSSPPILYNNFYKQTFSLTIDLLNDFGDEKAKDKSFVAKLTRKDGNYIYTEYKLRGDSSNPSISPITPAYETQTVNMAEDLILEFKGIKESGLAIDTGKYSIKRVDVSPEETISGSYDTTSGTYKGIISSEDLTQMNIEGIMPRYRFTATDIFGNTNYKDYTLKISNLPVLKGISSTAANLCKLGDEILIDASFSGTVYVDSSLSGENRPYIKLKGITNASSSITSESIVPAYYKEGSGTTTLRFSYTVGEKDVSSGLCVYNESGIGPININGATLLSSSYVVLKEMNDSDNLQAKKTIVLDGIVPSITNTSVESSTSSNTYNGITYLREGRTASITITTNETVYVQGSPAFILK
ncbi:MAG: hypothetical protein K5873_07240, partial [Treponema sp.]|nr:hypothetical protein [Treponema sp.]